MLILIALLTAAAAFLVAAPLGRGRATSGDPWSPAGVGDNSHATGDLSRLEQGLRARRLPLTTSQYSALLIAIPAATFLLARVMTGAWLTAIICLPAGPLILNAVFDFLAHHRTRTLRDQLQEALLSLATSLKAGQSLTNALERAVRDLQRLHPRGAFVLEELSLVVREVQMGVPVDQALLRLRERVPLEEVSSLVDAVVITRRRGGNIVEVMGNVAHMIADRMAIDREIQVMTAQKRAEAAILALIPLVIYLLTRFTNPEYMAVFHQTTGGQIALGIIFLAIIGGYWLANRLTRIDV